MALPEANITIQDGALGISTPTGANTLCLIGPCSSGTAGTNYEFSDITTLKNTLGVGPLVEAAAHVLAIAGGTVVCHKPLNQVAGVCPASPTAVQTGTATLAASTAANDAYLLKILIVTGGATLVAAAATFKYSLDNGATYSAEIALPASGVYVIPNTGITLTWTYASGVAFVAGDDWTATCTAPSNALADVGTAIDTVLADGTLAFFAIKIVGEPSSIANGATMFSSLATKMSTAASSLFRYLYVMMDLPTDTDSNTKSPFAALADTRVAVNAGFCRLASQLTGSAYKRNAGWVAAARAAKVKPSEDLGRVATGPCPGISSLDRDEFRTPGLDVARFTTLRTLVGKQGFFLTTGRIFATAGSDFSYQPNRRVMDIACAKTREGMLEFLNDSILVNSSTGLILEAEARTIEARIEALLRAEITQKGDASDIGVTVDRTVNILSTQTLKLTVRVTPLGYARTINAELGFFNPALQPVVV